MTTPEVAEDNESVRVRRLRAERDRAIVRIEHLTTKDRKTRKTLNEARRSWRATMEKHRAETERLSSELESAKCELSKLDAIRSAIKPLSLADLLASIIRSQT